MTKVKPLRWGWITSSHGEGSVGLLHSVLDAIKWRGLNAEILFVFDNSKGTGWFFPNKIGEELMFSDQKNHIFYTNHPERVCHEIGHATEQDPVDVREDDMLFHIKGFKTDYDIFAGYGHISKKLHKERRILNVHPAHPHGPVGTWKDVAKYLIKHKEPLNGVTLHHVTDDLDRGPVVAYCTYPVRKHTLEAIREDMLYYERKFLPLALQHLDTRRGALKWAEYAAPCIQIDPPPSLWGIIKGWITRR